MRRFDEPAAVAGRAGAELDRNPSARGIAEADAAGHAYTDANALMGPSVGGYSIALGYAPNDSDVVSATTSGYQGLAPGARAPATSETLFYSTSTTLSGIAPMNQTSIVFTSNGTTTQGA